MCSAPLPLGEPHPYDCTRWAEVQHARGPNKRVIGRIINHRQGRRDGRLEDALSRFGTEIIRRAIVRRRAQ